MSEDLLAFLRDAGSFLHDQGVHAESLPWLTAALLLLTMAPRVLRATGSVVGWSLRPFVPKRSPVIEQIRLCLSGGAVSWNRADGIMQSPGILVRLAKEPGWEPLAISCSGRDVLPDLNDDEKRQARQAIRETGERIDARERSHRRREFLIASRSWRSQ